MKSLRLIVMGMVAATGMLRADPGATTATPVTATSGTAAVAVYAQQSGTTPWSGVTGNPLTTTMWGNYVAAAGYTTWNASALTVTGTAAAAHKLINVFEGDSITFYGSPAQGSTWSYGYDLTSGAAGSYFAATTGTTVATSGATLWGATNSLYSRYTALVHPFAPNTTGTAAILWVLVGANDYDQPGFKLPVYTGSLNAYYQLAHADGFKVAAFTVTPRSTDYLAQNAAQWEANRRDLNVVIRTDTNADFIEDRDAFFAPGYATVGTSVSSDGIHPTAMANLAMAQHINGEFSGTISTTLGGLVPMGTMAQQNANAVGITGGVINGATVASPALSGTLNGPINGGDQTNINLHAQNFSGNAYTGGITAPIPNTLDFYAPLPGQFGIGLGQGAMNFASGNSSFNFFGGGTLSSTGAILVTIRGNGIALPTAGEFYFGNLAGNALATSEAMFTTSPGTPYSAWSGQSYTDTSTSSWTRPGGMLLNDTTTGSFVPFVFATRNNNTGQLIGVASLVAHVTNHAVYGTADLGIWLNSAAGSQPSEMFRFSNTGNLMLLSGTLSLSGTVTAPSNTSAPVAWGAFLSGTNTYRTPLYQ